MKTIIVTTDFSDASTNAVLFAADMALKVNARLQVYHAVPERAVLVDNLDFNVEYTKAEEALQQLDALQKAIKEHTQYRLSIDVQLKYGNINHVLKATCKQAIPFAVVMPVTEKTTIERFWLGSGTLAVSHNIQAPVLIIPQKAKFNGFKKIAVATDLNDVYDTMPLQSLTRWIEAFNPALEFVFVQENGAFEAQNVPEVVALQTHFEKYLPSFHYIKSNHIVDGITTYLNESRPDILMVIPKKHTLLHKSIAKQFIIHPAIPVVILTGYH